MGLSHVFNLPGVVVGVSVDTNKNDMNTTDEMPEKNGVCSRENKSVYFCSARVYGLN